jgi:UDP-N-acetylmuramoyl-tripeptide--D-alanyl-D-alanine ligase
LFVAVEGERFDGNQFADAALAKGAIAAVVNQSWLQTRGEDDQGVFLGVLNTVDTLAELAREVRNEFDGLVVAVTGSNGKTTTKELIGCLLRETFETVVAPASWNNRIGVPLTLFRIREQHRAVMLELGMNAPGEIMFLSNISKPEIGVVTNIGQAHIGGLGSLDKIAREKADLAGSVPASGAVILNGDDAYLRALEIELEARTLFFGFGEDNEVRPEKWEDRGLEGISVVLDGCELSLPLLGRHSVYNVLAAWTVGRHLGFKPEHMASCLAKASHLPSRLEVQKVGGVTLLNDTYNANPISMKVALEVASNAVVRGKRYVVCGDMLELGDWAEEAHTDVGSQIGSQSFAGCFLVGSFADITAQAVRDAGGAVLFCGPESEGLAEELARIVTAGDLVLLKASRAMGLERVIEQLRCLLEGPNTGSQSATNAARGNGGVH